MSEPEYGFFFEKAGKGATQGAISPAEQFFEGSKAEASLVRETGQNSIDARAGVAPVTMVFELADMPTGEIPGIDGLRLHLAQVEEQTRRTQGHDGMVLARRTANAATIPVLRIGDYGTKGLSGRESINDPKSPLSALTRGAGISADDGSRGGSFGIGSAVGPMASDMSTVLYTSLPEGGSEVVFAGYSCLATHQDAQGAWRVGDGFFTDLNEEDFHYLRDPEAVGPFPPRTEPGTDVYVLGYRKASADPDLHHIKVAFMRNFLVAIDRGELVVKGITSSHTWQLDSSSLQEYVAEDAEALAFYRAIKDTSPIVRESERFGRMTLYVNVDDSLERTLHTITVRKPLMTIDTFRHTSIPVKYAAVLECSDDIGNSLLRTLEPPQHHKWDPGRAANGQQMVKELKDFVREGLKSRVHQEIGQQVEVKGLSKYLPDKVFHDKSVEEAAWGGIPVPEPGVEQESSTVRGATGNERSAAIGGRKSVRIGVRTSASREGDSTTSKGKDAGGSKDRTKKGGEMPGTGNEGEGAARITAGDIRFRSWSDAATGDVYLALTAAQDLAGDLELVAVGARGRVEEDYVLPIARGTLLTEGNTTPLKHDGNVLAELKLKADVTSQVRLELHSNSRYRLGIR